MNSAKEQMQLARLREAVYNGYNSLLTTGKQEDIDFPDFQDTGDFIYYSDNIEDEKLKGKTCLVGKVISRRNIIQGQSGIVVRTEEGIELFEHYTRRGFRPMLIIPGDKGLITNLTALEKHPEELQGNTPEQIIGLNFDYFPLLMCKKEQLSKEEYQKFYLSLFCRTLLFF